MARQRIKPQTPPPADPPAETAPAPVVNGAASAPPKDPAPQPPTGRRRTGAAPSAPVESKAPGAPIVSEARHPASPPPQSSAEALASKPEAADAARALAEELAKEPEVKIPFSKYPTPSEALAGIVSTVIDEGEGLDLKQEFDGLMTELQVNEALTPQAIKAHINKAEANAMRAHRLYVLTKAQFEKYRIHAETALGAMRDVAISKLSQMKKAGDHAKQITDQNVEDMAASLFPDQWGDIKERLSAAKLTLENLARFADLWQRRSWSLSELNK